jgi:hypothetical protein
MSTFIDRLETDLVLACDAPIAARRSWPGPLERFSHRGRLRTLAVLAALAAVATPAIAIGLGPILRDGQGQTLSTTSDAPPAEQLALLGILRDPPPGTYVDPDTLRSSLFSEVHGVRTNYIRLLPPMPGFPRMLLYTLTSGKYGPARFDPAVDAYVPTEAKNLICVEADDADGIGGSCNPTSALTSGWWFGSENLNGYGLVPDGVASVVLHYPDHPAQTEKVTDNTFSWHGYPAPAGPITSGDGQPSPGATPEVRSSVTWLNANGEVIATHVNSNVASQPSPLTPLGAK